MLTRRRRSTWPGRPASSRQGPCTGDRGRGEPRSVPVGACLYQLSPLNSCGALCRLHSPLKATAQGLPGGWALAAPPSASCAECLDNWMECFATTALPGSLSSGFKRGGRGCWLQGEGRRPKRSKVSLEPTSHSPPDSQPTPGLREATGHPAPSVVERWSQAQAPGRTGQREEADKWCQRSGEANLVKSGSVDSLGSGRGRAQDSTLRTSLRLLRFCNRNGSISYHLRFTDRTLGVQRE